jgi:hypothetical protein
MVRILFPPPVSLNCLQAMCSPFFLCVRLNSGLSGRGAHGRFNRTSSSGADHGKGSIFISETSSTRGPIPLGQK